MIALLEPGLFGQRWEMPVGEDSRLIGVYFQITLGPLDEGISSLDGRRGEGHRRVIDNIGVDDHLWESGKTLVENLFWPVSPAEVWDVLGSAMISRRGRASSSLYLSVTYNCSPVRDMSRPPRKQRHVERNVSASAYHRFPPTVARHTEVRRCNGGKGACGVGIEERRGPCVQQSDEVSRHH